jgi:very-short-patch-repair endonuclease
MIPYDKNLKEISKSLRHNLTEAERCLWKRLQLRHLGYVFYRQKPGGDYIVDFYCPKARLIVEVDGGQHLTKDTRDSDKVRDEYMRSLGLSTLRFSNSDVLKNTDRVAESIYKILLNPPLRKGDKREAGKATNLEGMRHRLPLKKGEQRRILAGGHRG